MPTLLTNGPILIDGVFHGDFAVAIDGARIAAAGPKADIRETFPHAEVRDLNGERLVPGYIDTQVNGGGGVLFNDAPTVETIARIGAAHRRFGTTGFLPTLISDDLSVIDRAIDAVEQAMAEGVPGVLGIHIEGPFLNIARKGIHDPAKFRILDDEAVRLLTRMKTGRTLITLAPERVPRETIQQMVANGAIVAAGHTAGTYDEIRAGLDAGITGFTHLYNAMSPLQGRDPGAVGAALEDADSWCGVIVDGVHVHPASLRVALAAKPRGKVFLVTDAMPMVGSDNPTFELYGETITAVDGVVRNAAGALAGSALDMITAVRNTVGLLGLSLAEASRMASTYPAQFLGLRVQVGGLLDQYELWC